MYFLWCARVKTKSNWDRALRTDLIQAANFWPAGIALSSEYVYISRRLCLIVEWGGVGWEVAVKNKKQKIVPRMFSFSQHPYPSLFISFGNCELSSSSCELFWKILWLLPSHLRVHLEHRQIQKHFQPPTVTALQHPLWLLPARGTRN